MKTVINREAAEKALTQFKRKDLQRACIIRGMDFAALASSSDLDMQGWFLKNYENPVDEDLLAQYDKWFDKFLIKERGYSRKRNAWAFHPSLKMSFHEPEDEEQEVVKPEPKEKKVPKQKDAEVGIYTGTKKALTYKLAKKGLPFETVCTKVLKQFPEAQEKSIKIWYKKAIQLFGVEQVKPTPKGDKSYYLEKIQKIWETKFERANPKKRGAFWKLLTSNMKVRQAQSFNSSDIRKKKINLLKKFYKSLKSTL